MRSSERLVFIGGVGLVVASFVPWYKPDQFAFGAERTNGWEDPDALLSQIGVVAGALLAVVVLVASRQPSRPTAGGLRWGTLLTIGGVVAFGAVALKYLLNMEGTTVGVYLALATSLTQLYGGYVTHVEDTDQPPSRAGGPVTPFPLEGPPQQPLTGRQPGQPSNGLPPGQPSAGAPPGQWGGYLPPQGAPAAAPARPALPAWPETVYFLQAWARSGPTVEAAVAAYREAFAADTARQLRLLGEAQTLLDPSHTEEERHQLLVAHAPTWSGWPAYQVFTQLVRALSERPTA